MKKILIASSNADKVKEIRTLVSDLKEYEIISPADFGIFPVVEENGFTLEENSLIKAKAFHKVFGYPVISDDTGLFTDALNGEPGVYSARYAGLDADYTDNYKKLLINLNEVSGPNRKANFKSVICYCVAFLNYLIEYLRMFLNVIANTKKSGFSNWC